MHEMQEKIAVDTLSRKKSCFLPVFLYNRIGDCHVQDEPEMLPEVQEGFYCGALSEDLWGVQGAKTNKAISQDA